MTHIAKGVPDGALHHLSDRDKRIVLRLMARISEASYRRGAQQGAHFAMTAPHALPRDIAAWRFNRSLDRAPPLEPQRHALGYGNSAWRLDCEYGLSLFAIGLHVPEPDAA